MRIIEPRQIRQRQARRLRRHTVRRSFIFLITVVFAGGYGYIAFQRPLPQASTQIVDRLDVPAQVPKFDWPTYGQAAFGAQDYGVLATNGQQKPFPMASVAKTVTALAILKQKPLTRGEQGSVLTLTNADVAIYNRYVAQNGSVALVESGEQITEYQALQAIMLPSANNMAETLANWAFGSQADYVAYANNLVKSYGMTNTHIADASGFSPGTTSTAQDLVLLGTRVMANPILAEIVAQAQATLPVAGLVRNVNYQLGENGVIGIKTGNTAEAGGCYLMAATRTFDAKHTLTLIVAVMGAPNLATAMRDSLAVLATSYQNFSTVKIAAAGQVVGLYRFAWGDTGKIETAQPLYIFAWNGQPLKPQISFEPISSTAVARQQVGTLTVTANKQTITSPLILKQNIHSPSWRWRLFNF